MKKTPQLFDISNEGLKQIEFSHSPLPQISVGELWRYFEGVNLGQEISKDGEMKRSCLIIKSISHSSLIRVLPITSKVYPEKLYKMKLTKWQYHGLKKESSLLLHQIKCIDKKRLIDKIRGSKVGGGIIKRIFSIYFL